MTELWVRQGNGNTYESSKNLIDFNFKFSGKSLSKMPTASFVDLEFRGADKNDPAIDLLYDCLDKRKRCSVVLVSGESDFSEEIDFSGNVVFHGIKNHGEDFYILTFRILL